MSHELRDFRFDGDLGRYTYEEFWPIEGDWPEIDAWMTRVLFSTADVKIPDLISDIRYVERKFDPKALGNEGEQVVILGLSHSDDYDDMRSPDRLDDDEIKIKLVSGCLGTNFEVTLLEDAVHSMQLLSSLRLFGESCQL